MLFDNVFCPKAQAEEAQIFLSDEVKAIEKANTDFLRYLAVKGGYSETAISLRNLWLLFDPLNSEVRKKFFYFF